MNDDFSARLCSLEERLLESNKKIESLEADRARFLEALKGAAEMCLQNPMVAAMVPKEVKQRLREVVGHA